MTLTLAPMNTTLHIIKIKGKDDQRSFLRNLGFVEGAQVMVVNELAGNVIVQIKDSRIALGKELSNRIVVTN